MSEDSTGSSGKLPDIVSERREKSSRDHLETLSYDLKKLFTILILEPSGASDLTLLVESKPLPVHKAILAARCPKLLDGLPACQKCSKKRIKKHDHELVLGELDLGVAQQLIEFAYSGKVEDIGEQPMKLFKAAQLYDVLELKDICERTLCREVDIENFVKYYVFAEENKCNLLESELNQFIANRTKDILRQSLNEKLHIDRPSIFEKIAQIILVNMAD